MLSFPPELPIKHALEILNSVNERSSELKPEQIVYDAPPSVTTTVLTQHWAKPYDTDYILIRADRALFKTLDYLVISAKAEPTLEELTANEEQNTLNVVMRLRQNARGGKTFLR